jgi:alanyl-tRNA synthetase
LPIRSGREIRSAYLRFFAERGHEVRPGAPLAPGDPSLLFTTAGMVQFKPLYSTPPEKLPYRRATTVQKCLRANDLESVGRTLRHHTFFEMLGNFSFGDYFKPEAIEWAWDFSTSELQLDRKRLWVSVYEDDDEAARLWKGISGLPKSRIVRLGQDHNFWGPAGETGACGPSSELYYDSGQAHGCKRAACAVGCDCDRYIEFWNLVFPQFDMRPDGTMLPLEHPGIDTGLGLERTAFITQGVRDNFHSDLFQPIIARVQELSGIEYARDESTRLAMNAVADHVRALTFALAENIYPSNDGRGYVLRRILRRASGKLRSLGVHEPFLHRLVDAVVSVMGDAYAELQQARGRVAMLIENEERRFVSTLETGMGRFEAALEKAAKQGGVLSGADVFTLYDTYGFPAELTAEMAQERGVRLDMDGFRSAMEAQRERARAGAAFREQAREGSLPQVTWSEPAASMFVGYERVQDESTLQVLRWRRGEHRDADASDGLALSGETFELVLDSTPFYATAGGQVADQGVLASDDFIWRVLDVRRDDEHIVHVAVLLQHPARLRGWDDLVEWLGKRDALRVRGSVQEAARWDTARNHTATHILHAALKKLVGAHVTQAGSLVAPDRLRFDFNHVQALEPAQLSELEDAINEVILHNIPVQTDVEDYEQAVADGAIAMFGEKYDSRVRVVKVGDYSMELCGGTHVRRTGDIGAFVITSEGSIAAGVRRLEALTGRGAMRYIAAMRERQGIVSRTLGLGAGQDAVRRIAEIQDENRRLRRALEQAQSKLAGSLSTDLLDAAVDVDGARVVSARVEVDSVDALRELADAVRRELHSGAAVLSTEMGDKIVFLATVTDDLVKRGVRAGEIVSQIARITGGGGGGKPHLAQAGGRDKSRWQEALDQVVPLVRSKL